MIWFSEGVVGPWLVNRQYWGRLPTIPLDAEDDESGHPARHLDALWIKTFVFTSPRNLAANCRVLRPLFVVHDSESLSRNRNRGLLGHRFDMVVPTIDTVRQRKSYTPGFLNPSRSWIAVLLALVRRRSSSVHSENCLTWVPPNLNFSSATAPESILKAFEQLLRALRDCPDLALVRCLLCWANPTTENPGTRPVISLSRYSVECGRHREATERHGQSWSASNSMVLAISHRLRSCASQLLVPSTRSPVVSITLESFTQRVYGRQSPTFAPMLHFLRPMRLLGSSVFVSSKMSNNGPTRR